MKRFFIRLLSVMFILGLLNGETVTRFRIPKLNGRADRAPGIAANRLGDIMITWTNDMAGVCYYFKKHDSDQWIGPTAVTTQPYPTTQGWGEDILMTDVAATKDGNFHVVWGFYNAPPYTGFWYSMFDISTQTWGTAERLCHSLWKVESPKIDVNPKTDDVIAYWCWLNTAILDKDIYIRVKKNNVWGELQNISKGGMGDTTPAMGFDPTGRTYLSYKVDVERPNENFDLTTRMHWLDPNNGYKNIYYDEMGYQYEGWQFCPGVAGFKDGRGLLIFAYNPEGAYFGMKFKCANNIIDYDTKGAFNIAPMARNPWYQFQTKMMNYQDEIMFAYKDPGKKVILQRYGSDEKFSEPIEISSFDMANWEFEMWCEPKIGVLFAWESMSDNQDIGCAIYDLKKIFIDPPINFTLTHKTEKSVFDLYYLNQLSWEHNPLNTESKISIANYRIYRKAKSDKEYIKLIDLSGSTLQYIDKNKIGATNTYDYAISAIDTDGNESSVQEIK